MRVMVFGQEDMIHKLASVAGDGVEVVGIPDGADKMMALQKQDCVDLRIVDSTAEIAEAACRQSSGFRDIPLVLIVDRKQADWKKLESLAADGYLTDMAENAELAARLKAMLRRLVPVGRVNQESLAA